MDDDDAVVDVDAVDVDAVVDAVADAALLGETVGAAVAATGGAAD